MPPANLWNTLHTVLLSRVQWVHPVWPHQVPTCSSEMARGPKIRDGVRSKNFALDPDTGQAPTPQAFLHLCVKIASVSYPKNLWKELLSNFKEGSLEIRDLVKKIPITPNINTEREFFPSFFVVDYFNCTLGSQIDQIFVHHCFPCSSVIRLMMVMPTAYDEHADILEERRHNEFDCVDLISERERK